LFTTAVTKVTAKEHDDDHHVDGVSELRPPKSLLFILKRMHVYGEPRRNDVDRKKPNKSEKRLYETRPFQIRCIIL
jgi:hypothetical protein